MSTNNNSEIQTMLPIFGQSFMEDHAKSLVTNPKIALVELIANSWDAGANRVAITWPLESMPDIIAIEDDGTGMTHEEFKTRWYEFNYNRKDRQGAQVTFPDDNQKSNRTAFGRSGKGRHSMFCFSNQYQVETWREGTCNIYQVERTQGSANVPYTIKLISRKSKVGHGTRLSTELTKANWFEVLEVKDLIGSKFVVDPVFHIFVNSEQVMMENLSELKTESIKIEGIGIVKVSSIGSERGRTARQHGVAWWVNNRLVGEPSWQGFDEQRYLDGRTTEAHRRTFIVQADFLIDEVMEDWSDFNKGIKFNATRDAVSKYITKELLYLFKDVHKENKIQVIQENSKILRTLTPTSRMQIGKYIDQIQERMPTIQQTILSNTVAVLSRLEQARTGYMLLEQLAKLNVNDLDSLAGILRDWSVQEAMVVLDELGRRMELIESLQKLCDNPSSNELHQLHPLFEKGLWIFGPEYESLQFMSNRTLTTVINELLNKQGLKAKYSALRPDFVALPDSTISVFSLNSFDKSSEVSGYEKILILELKKGGSHITENEMWQAKKYATELRKTGKIEAKTKIVTFVLGSFVDAGAQEEMKIGEFTDIYARTFSIILQKAQARTFNLKTKIEELKQGELTDPDMEKVVSSKQLDLHY